MLHVYYVASTHTYMKPYIHILFNTSWASDKLVLDHSRSLFKFILNSKMIKRIYFEKIRSSVFYA